MSELIPTVSIDNLLSQRDAIADRLRKVGELLAEAQALMDNAHFECQGEKQTLRGVVGGPTKWYTDYPLCKPEEVDAAIVRLDVAAWSYLMRDSGLRSFMDHQARAEWKKQLDWGMVPPLTRENLASTFAHIYDTRVEMFERGVVRLFEGLSWKYKTNEPIKLGRRIVIERLTAGGFLPDLTSAKLIDLDRAFRVLDGKPEEDHRNGLFQRVAAVTIKSAVGVHHDEYMVIRFCKNTNGHVTFTRADLVDKLNAIIAKHYPNAIGFERNAPQRRQPHPSTQLQPGAGAVL